MTVTIEESVPSFVSSPAFARSPAPALGTLRMPGGGAPIEWDPRLADQVAAVRAVFDLLLAAGHLACRVDESDRTSAEQIREFDPDAREIIIIRALQGG